MYSDRNATMSGAERRGSAGMDRRSNAVWVLPQAGKREGTRGMSPRGKTWGKQRELMGIQIGNTALL